MFSRKKKSKCISDIDGKQKKGGDCFGFSLFNLNHSSSTLSMNPRKGLSNFLVTTFQSTTSN